MYKLIIVSVYALTMTNPDEVKDKFYDDLDSVISETLRTETRPPRGLQCQSRHRPSNLLRSDWNRRSREVQQQWSPPFKKCAEHELLITNAVFRLPTRNKISWIHPRTKH